MRFQSLRDFSSCFNAKVVDLFDMFTVIAISQDEDRCICSILVAVFVGHSFGQGIITFFTLYYSLIINFVFSRTERKLKAFFLCHHTKQKQNLFIYFLCLALFTNSFPNTPDIITFLEVCPLFDQQVSKTWILLKNYFSVF